MKNLPVSVRWIWVLKYTLLALCSVLIAPNTLTAQSDVPSIVVAQFPRDGAINFLEIKADGTATVLGTLPPEFRLINEQSRVPDRILIGSPIGIVISPNQQYVAVSGQQDQEFTLYVYRITGEQVWAVETNGPVAMYWSADSGGFAFIRDVFSQSDNEEIGVMYFDLQSGEITTLAALEQMSPPRNLSWINDQTLSLTVHDYPLKTMTLMTVTRDGIITPLFSAPRSDAVGSYPSICEYEWSERLQMFFVVTSCALYESIVLQELYSVDLEGNAELLLSAPEEYRVPTIYRAYYNIVGIEVHNENVYVVTSPRIYRHEIGYSLSYSGEWNVLSWNGQEWTRILSETDRETFGFVHPRISRDGRYLVGGQYGPVVDRAIPNALIVIDLTTRDIVRRAETQSAYSDSLTWFDHFRFLYANSYFGNGSPVMSSLAQIVDLSRLPANGIVLPIDSDAPIWLPH